MKILVTGALGFIGSNIVERLVNEGHQITALDNLHTGSEQNIEQIKDKVRFINGGAGDIKDMEEKFDVIFHQGIYSSSPMYKENPHLTATVIDEFISVLEYAKKNRSKVVWAATSSVYNGQEPPHREDMDVKISDFYTEARYEMERLAELYNKLFDVQVIGLRYFSVYGPHEKSKGKYANLISQFLWDLQNDKAPVVFGDGSQTRDFTYVDDVVEANLLAMDSELKFGVFNVGTGRSITINEMITMLNQKLGKDIEPELVANPIKNYVQDTLADTSKAEAQLHFKAKIALEHGIEKLIDYYST
jgi:UDP-glucose 4-epimerase